MSDYADESVRHRSRLPPPGLAVFSLSSRFLAPPFLRCFQAGECDGHALLLPRAHDAACGVHPRGGLFPDHHRRRDGDHQKAQEGAPRKKKEKKKNSLIH